MISTKKPNVFSRELEAAFTNSEHTNFLKFICDSEDYVVYKKFPDKQKTLFRHRFNAFWVYPLFVVLMPFRYLFWGSAFVNIETKLGRILTYLLGDY